MHESYDYGIWSMVIFNVILFGAFVLGFLRPKKKYEWRTLGVFAAFIIALFTEMYGFPLTIYFLISLFGDKLGIVDPFQHVNGHLLGSLFGAPEWIKLIICQIGGFVMLIGLIMMGKGWRKIHEAKGELVTDGIYAYMRHPQYSGLFLITIGMLIQWPTLITLIMWPVLMYAYYRLAMREERAVETQFGETYQQYRESVPAFIPRVNRHDKSDLLSKNPAKEVQ
ncbi:MAG: isoprenylcysteine carboxylmethyltransferase family protein [Calditrichia bacterium]|nr:isoprenylcysteine carboxylmethyltransferase family protein [Calditrichota bacterium]MCB0266645.1 isoprenylcysteine carboxylmethyltransferase family protein [Calditrichota bacterium]MCB9067218.1 isoprenylcysteine carboxylmethyltransferase family protein [Calditrichia bacterium]